MTFFILTTKKIPYSVFRAVPGLTSRDLTYSAVKNKRMPPNREQTSFLCDMTLINLFITLRYDRHSFDSSLQVILEGVAGSGIYGDIAVDDFSLLGQKQCDTIMGNG